MSIRPVEVQIGVPRTQDAGKIQEQLQQRGQVAQDVISQETKKEADNKRQQVNQSDESAKASNNGEGSNGNGKKKQNKEKKETEKTKASHPFKGQFIDFSG